MSYESYYLWLNTTGVSPWMPASPKRAAASGGDVELFEASGRVYHGRKSVAVHIKNKKGAGHRRKKRLIIAVMAIFVILIIGFVLMINYLAHRFYPLRYTDEIISNSKRYSLEPSLVSAIIYEESKFEPDVVSSKDAIGLMQILPDTANFYAFELGFQNLKRDELFIPENNIKFGTYYIKSLLNRYNGDKDLALAAYNAGFGTVDKINGDLSKLPKETQEFIERVKRTERVYATLYSGQLNVGEEQLQELKLNFFEITNIIYNRFPKNQ